MGNQPAQKYKVGAVTATIWENKAEKGVYYTVQVSRSYMDKDKKWQNTESLRANDLPKAVLALQKAYEWLNTNDKNEE